MAGVSIEQLIDAAHRVRLDARHSYHISYPYLVAFFQSPKELDAGHVVVGAHMAYGWMPTILGLRGGDLDDVARLLSWVRSGQRLLPVELTRVKRPIQDSIIGASKVLHFVNPSVYPIWDSNTCCFFLDKQRKPGHDVVNRLSTYLAYVANCDALVGDPSFSAVQQIIEAQLGYAVSAYRAAELVMYEAGKRSRGEAAPA